MTEHAGPLAVQQYDEIDIAAAKACRMAEKYNPALGNTILIRALHAHRLQAEARALAADQIANIPAEWTGIEIRSRGNRSAWVATLSKEDEGLGEIIAVGHGETFADAIRAAIQEPKEGLVE
jgi:hypothetical protein